MLERSGSQKGDPCPLGTDIFAVLRHVAAGDFSSAYGLLLATNPLPAVTGRLCPEVFVETQVFNRKSECVSWRAIERFIGDHARAPRPPAVRQRQKVAVIGSGPAGLTAAFYLRRQGFRVTVFEASHVPGGSLGYAYPPFRLPVQVLNRIFLFLKEEGIDVQCNVLFGRGLLADELWDKGYAALLLACGAGFPVPFSAQGADAAGIFPVEEFLRFRHWMKAGDERYRTPLAVGGSVVLAGQGEKMFDAARILVRLGRRVTVLINGSETHAGVDAATLREASEEGVKIQTFVRPVSAVKDHAGCIRFLECERMDYKIDPQGRLNMVAAAEDARFSLDLDTFITCFGGSPDTMFLRDIPGLEPDIEGCLRLRPGALCETAVNGIFACGHLLAPAADIATVINSARNASVEIAKFLDEA